MCVTLSRFFLFHYQKKTQFPVTPTCEYKSVDLHVLQKKIQVPCMCHVGRSLQKITYGDMRYNLMYVEL